MIIPIKRECSATLLASFLYLAPINLDIRDVTPMPMPKAKAIIKRIIEETGAGVIYSDADIMELSRILNNTGSLPYKEMATKGKEAVLQKYNWQKDGNVLLDLYKKLATGNNPYN